MRFSYRMISAAACIVAAVTIASPAKAEIIYVVTVNTGSQSGQTGFIDLQFNPGDATSQLATIAITGFSGGTLEPGLTNTTGAPFGDVSGTLPDGLTFDNGQTTNEYTEGIVFGDSVSFLATFDGPAINSPNGSTGTLFSLDFLNQNGSAFLFTADPEGNNAFDFNVATIAINSDGSITPATYPDVGGSSDATVAQQAPEPSALALCAGALAALATRAALGIRRR